MRCRSTNKSMKRGRRSFFGNLAANDPALMARLYPTLENIGKTDDQHRRDAAQREFGSPAGRDGHRRWGAVSAASRSDIADPLIALANSAYQWIVLMVRAHFGRLRRTVRADPEGSKPQFTASVSTTSDFGTPPRRPFEAEGAPIPALWHLLFEGFRRRRHRTGAEPDAGFLRGLVDPTTVQPSDPTRDETHHDIPGRISGSKPHPKPEKSKSFTVGSARAEQRPHRSRCVSHHVAMRSPALDPNYLLAHESQYPAIERDPVTNEITRLNLPYSNLGSTTWGHRRQRARSRWPRWAR